METDWTPDIVIGVDFGMTCTGRFRLVFCLISMLLSYQILELPGLGVSYSFAPDWPTPKPLQHWPGLIGREIANKVPTQLKYLSSTPTVESWGFRCSLDSGDLSENVKKHFKLHLDPQFLDKRPDAPSHHEAMTYFKDYIQLIYRYTVSYMANKFPRFFSCRVEFIFSVPTTWKDPRMVTEFKNSITLDSPYHQAMIGLSEAEAAAVYASGNNYQQGDVVLVCDAGGGTTDVNILKVVSPAKESTSFIPLGVVEGKPVGSVMIDIGAHQLISSKLEQMRDTLKGSPQEIASQAMRTGHFERFKCAFGTQETDSLSLKLDCPSLSPEICFPEMGIANGQVIISRDEIQKFFDLITDEIYNLLDGQIRRLQLSCPLEHISFVVLSGGLGSSAYLTKRLKDRYENLAIVPNTIEILTVDEPQLAVAQGQVMNRIRQLKEDWSTIPMVCSRVSYGIICDKLYDPTRHLGESIRYDERDKSTYAVEQIDWLVIQGSPIPRVGISKEFKRKVYPRDMAKPWKAQIIMSTLSPEQLPSSMTHGQGARLICNIEVDMRSVEKKPKNQHWYNMQPTYFLANIIVKVIVGPMDLHFELWNKIGRKIQTTRQSPITVKWVPMIKEKDDDVKELEGSSAILETSKAQVHELASKAQVHELAG
ncbi:hypothetical protein N7520_002366 [Penicillium odoratum]|uniref:uncharacterized protein n=1 Tax=Penicillium odoratum TaxID=1167516 RepID=UPI002547074B|nr:uncharacterized protein N7520_002366 [Penicillium odoratum]KAJ5771837.1 hypothetical protein N7520_002366 [Penicillium odoratum]